MAKRTRERIYIVPRWPGIGFAFVVLLIFAIGFAFVGSRELTHILGISLVVAGLVALIQSNDNVRGLEIIGCRAVPTPAGEVPVLEVSVRNSAVRERIGLHVRRAIPWRKAWRLQPAGAWLPMLEPGQTLVARLPLDAVTRGVYAIPRLWVCSVMPFGLCFAWKDFGLEGSYFVYPKPRGVSLEERNLGSDGDLQGAGAGGDDVSGHRPYEAGDPLSRMDWRVFARTGKMVVRTLDEGGSGDVVLRWRDTAFLDDPEARLEQLSGWMTQCVREGRPFLLDLSPHRGEIAGRNLASCQEALATFPGGAA
ncbi:hypothetical protein DB345_20065 [Spartobacteria bacterium LR76]|nr:hypothetical protein DB345_20065 [Spartobacteria bacterium LR76]